MNYTFVDEEEPDVEQQPQEKGYTFVDEEEEKPAKEEKSFGRKALETAASFAFNPNQFTPFPEKKQNLAISGLSGATFGGSELVPGLEAEEGISSEAAKLVGSTLPISKIYGWVSKPLASLASKSPILQSQLKSGANLLATAITGGVVGSAEKVTEEKDIEKLKAPSMEDFLAHGVTWAAIDTGLRVIGKVASFGKAFVNYMSESGDAADVALKKVSDAVKYYTGSDEQIAQKAIEILEQNPKGIDPTRIKLSSGADKGKVALTAEEQFAKDVEQRGVDLQTKKISKQDFTKMEQAPPEPYFPNEFSTTQVAEEMIDSEVNTAIDSIAERAPSQKQLGENIVMDIENTAKKWKETTDELYQKSKGGMLNKTANTDDAVNSIIQQVNKLDKGNFKTNPKGYEKAREQLMDLIEDMGFKVLLDDAGRITNSVKVKDLSLSDAIDLKKRVNDLIDYDLIETSAQDFLKDPASKLREAIRNGYGPADNQSRKAFELAEKTFGENSEKLGKGVVRNARKSEKPESLAKTIMTPSGFSNLKAVASPQQIAEMEREVLENMKGMTEDRARAFFREMRGQLSDNSKAVAEQILESKVPKGSPGRKELQRTKIQEGLFDDLSKATITGERPERALNLWKTTEGQQLVKNALEGNPNKAEVIKYLQDQSLKDFSATVVDETGKIDFKKLNQLMNDPATAKNIEMIGGKDAVNFYKNLEQISNRIQKNMSVMEGRIDRGSARDRRELQNAMERKGKEKLQSAAEKANAPTESQALGAEKLGPKNAKERAETIKAKEAKGKDKFKKIRESKEEAEKSAAEAAKKAEQGSLLYRFDDYLNSYGVKAKGLMAGLGILKFGTAEGIALSLAYEAFMKMARSPRIRHSLRRAAGAGADNPKILIKALDEINEESKG